MSDFEHINEQLEQAIAEADAEAIRNAEIARVAALVQSEKDVVERAHAIAHKVTSGWLSASQYDDVRRMYVSKLADVDLEGFTGRQHLRLSHRRNPDHMRDADVRETSVCVRSYDERTAATTGFFVIATFRSMGGIEYGIDHSTFSSFNRINVKEDPRSLDQPRRLVGVLEAAKFRIRDRD